MLVASPLKLSKCDRCFLCLAVKPLNAQELCISELYYTDTLAQICSLSTVPCLLFAVEHTLLSWNI